MESDLNEPEPGEERRPAWLRWTIIVGVVIALLCCIGCGIELVRFFGWLSSTHPS